MPLLITGPGCRSFRNDHVRHARTLAGSTPDKLTCCLYRSRSGGIRTVSGSPADLGLPAWFLLTGAAGAIAASTSYAFIASHC